MKIVILIFITLVLIISVSTSVSIVSGEKFGYNNPTLPQLIGDLFGGKTSSFYMPNNLSVFGDFDFNGGFLNDGCTIRGGDILCQQGFFVNTTSLNITQQNLTVISDLVLDGFTQGSALFIGSSSQISEDNSNFFWDNSNNRLGIGTATPQNLLNVLGDINFTGLIYGNGSQLTGIIHTVDTNETTRFDALVLTDCSAGNLVIGIQSDGTVLCATDTGGIWTNVSGTATFVGDVNATGDIYSNSYQIISYQRTVNTKNVTMTAVI